MSENHKDHKDHKKESKGVSAGTIIKIGAGVAALAAASYYLFGPDGEGNRKHLKGWMIRMKGEIVEKIEQAKDISESTYNHIIDNVLAEYLASGTINVNELKAFARELKAEWHNISKPVKSTKTVKKHKKSA